MYLCGMKNRIKIILKEKGVSQNELAERLGVTHAVVSRSIAGNPTLKTLHAIAKALDVRVSDLIEEQPIDFVNCPYCGGKIMLSKE